MTNEAKNNYCHILVQSSALKKIMTWTDYYVCDEEASTTTRMPAFTDLGSMIMEHMHLFSYSIVVLG